MTPAWLRRCTLWLGLAAVISCGDGTGPSIELTYLAVGTPVNDTVARNRTKFYAVPVSPGALYLVTLTGLSDDVDLYPFDDDGAFTSPSTCLISHTLFFGTMAEDCTTTVTGDTMYIAVDASDASAASVTFTIAVQVLPVIELTLSTPLEDSVAQGALRYYRVTVAPGTEYSLSISALTDSATVFHVQDTDQGGFFPAVESPKALRLRAVGTMMFFAVDGSVLTKATSRFVMLAMAAPVLTNPVVPTSGPIAARTPTVGWVETRSTSTYRTDSLPAGTHSVSVLGVTGGTAFDVDFDVFSDSTYSMELPCTLNNFTARECTVSGTAVFFRVRSGPVNTTGAGYILLVW